MPCVKALSTRAAVLMGGSQFFKLRKVGKDRMVAIPIASSKNRRWYWSFGCDV